MLTTKQIRDLGSSIPTSLRSPGQGVVGEDPRTAILRVVEAAGGDISGVTFETLGQANRDDNQRLSVHPPFVALQLLAIAERQAGKPLPPEPETKRPIVAPVVPAIRNAARLHRGGVSLERRTAAKQREISRVMEKLLEEREAAAVVVAEKDAALWEHYQALKALRFRLVDPGVAAGYFHDRRVPVAVRRTTALLYYLHDCLRIPELRSLAYVGALRNGTVPVDVDHPDLDSIFDHHHDNLKRYRKRIRESQGAHGAGIYLTPGSADKPCSPLLANGATRGRSQQRRLSDRR